MNGKKKPGFYRDPTSIYPHEVLLVFESTGRWGVVAVSGATDPYRPTATGRRLKTKDWANYVPVEMEAITDIRRK